MQAIHRHLFSFTVLVLIFLNPAAVSAEVVRFNLDNIFTDRGGQMTGEFTWTFTTGDFENGVGEFITLNVPHTTHGLGDLITTIETNQIEISLDGNFHDDGVDVTLSLAGPFSISGPTLLDLNPTESKYSIGGNGFIDGGFISGSIAPASVPLPGAVFLFVSGLLGMFGLKSAFKRC